MKNILIVESSKDNTGSHFNWFSSVEQIPDINMRNAIIDSINKVEKTQSEYNKIEIIDNIIFSTSIGYYFSELSITKPPYKVDHIIEHIIC